MMLAGDKVLLDGLKGTYIGPIGKTEYSLFVADDIHPNLVNLKHVLSYNPNIGDQCFKLLSSIIGFHSITPKTQSYFKEHRFAIIEKDRLELPKPSSKPNPSYRWTSSDKEHLTRKHDQYKRLLLANPKMPDDRKEKIQGKIKACKYALKQIENDEMMAEWAELRYCSPYWID